MKLMLSNVRMAFPNLFEAKQVQGQGEPKFGCSLLFDKTHPAYKALLAATEEVGKAKWAAKWPEVKKGLGVKDRLAVHDGDAKSTYQGFEGNFFVSASNKVRPTAIDRDKSPLTAQDGKLYAGCYVNASVEVWAQDNTYGKGVNVSLRGVQFAADGEAFSAGGAADADEFEDASQEDELV